MHFSKGLCPRGSTGAQALHSSKGECIAITPGPHRQSGTGLALNTSYLQDTHTLTACDERKQEINADKNLQVSFQLKVITKINLVWEADFPLLKYPWYLMTARLLSTSLVIRLTLASMTYHIKS